MAKVSFSDPFVSANAKPYFTSCCKLDTNKYLIAYIDYDDSSKGKCVVATISGSDIYFGSIVTFANYTSYYISCCQINTDKAFIAWQKQSDQTGWAMYVTVSGTTITTKNECCFEDATAGADGNYKISTTTCCKLDTDKAIMVYYKYWGVTNILGAKVAVVNGDNLAFGGASPNITSGTFTAGDTVQMATDACYNTHTRSQDPYAIYLTVIGNNITVAQDFLITSDGNSYYPSICSLDSSYAFIAFVHHWGSPYYIKGVIVKTDGTKGSIATSPVEGSSNHLCAVALSSTKAMVSYRIETVNYRKLVIATISGTSVDFDSTEYMFREKNVSYSSAEFISASGSIYKALQVFYNVTDALGEAVIAQYQAVPTAKAYLGIGGSSDKLRLVETGDADYSTLRMCANITSGTPILNGEFEDWTAGDADHFTDSANAVSDEETADPYSGSSSLKLTASGAAQQYTQSDNVTVTAAKDYWLKFRYKNTVGDTAQYLVYDVTNGADIIAVTDLADSTAWSDEQSVKVTTPAGCVSIYVRLYAKADGNIVWFDNIYLNTVLAADLVEDNPPFNVCPVRVKDATDIRLWRDASSE